MRSRQVVKSIVMTLLLQICTFICGLILPRLFISHYGSEVNGLMNSITQFLSYIVLLDSGVGAVVRSAFYKPLADKDERKLSGIVKASDSFFRKIALILVIYMVVLVVVYPRIVKTNHSFMYTSSLVLIIGISSFFQYFFGMTNELLIKSDQKVWVSSLIQIGTLLLNTILTCILIIAGMPVHVVKLATCFMYILRPMVFYAYVHKHYHLDPDAKPDKEALNQKWDGLGQHLAYFVHKNTDVVILTLMDSLKNVSVYSLYQGIVTGIENVVTSLAQSITPTLGNMIALHEADKLHQTFDMYEMLNAMLISVFYTTTALCIVPFMSLYMKGVSDANYIQPIFAYFLIASDAMYVFRCPYLDTCSAAGHFRQTNPGAYAEAITNLVVSLLLVTRYHLAGIAFGTFLGMTLRTIYLIFYLRKNILVRPAKKAFGTMGVTGMAMFVSFYCVKVVFRFPITNFGMWVLLGFASIIVCIVFTLLFFFLVYRQRTIVLITKCVSVFRKQKG